MTTMNLPSDVGAAIFELQSTMTRLPLPATANWPDGVFDTEVFRQDGVSISLFAPRNRDYQSAHDQDEAYVIVQGQGTLRCNGTGQAFRPGDVLHVPAGQAHRFEGDLRELVAWVVFWEPGSAQANKSVVEQFVEAWKSGDVDAALAFTDPECLYSMTTGAAPGLEFRGRDEVRDGFALGIENEPGTAAVFEEPVAAGDRVLMEWSVVRLDDNSLVARGVDLFTLRDGLILIKDAHRKVHSG